MAELVGLVLSAFPIVIWALERYSEPFEAFHRYHTTIESFRSQLIIQHYQLEKTLLYIGLGRNPSREEIQECFETKFPQVSRELTFIVRQMDDITSELMRSLDVTIDAKQQQSLEKQPWNWSRVKHSIGTKKRNQLLERLRRLNEDLKMAVEKTELPEEADSSKVQELKLRFSSQRCASIRKCLSSLHRALGAGLSCTCAPRHHVAVDLDWRAYESSEMQACKVAISYNTGNPAERHIDSWKKLCFVPHIISKPVLPNPRLLAPAAPQRTPSPSSNMKSKMVRLASLSALRTAPPSPVITMPSSIADYSSGSVIITPSMKVTDLCDAVCNEQLSHTSARHLEDPENDPDADGYQRFLLDLNQVHMLDIIEAYPLKTLISLEHSSTGPRNPIHSLSAKQRYGIAAAIAWSVLHLAETPWLGESWSETQANLFVEIDRRTGITHLLKPYVSFPPTPKNRRWDLDIISDVLIPNRAIFSLGILLVELCLLNPSPKPRSLIEDYRAAVSRLDDVRRTAGCAYGDAAERCLKFTFSGLDIHKNFDRREFRTQFYNSVVAPVQAAYYLMPG
ncbi:hypothetical protein F4777DRAFT_598902 [Nemania sp. FL0916]|nr:hypothetical protein F4777DRAFT_598902 [Nemania sp. FL0916]